MFRKYLAGRPYLRDTRETQLFPSCLDSLHSSHVQGTCIISQDAYSQVTRENTSIFNLSWVFTHTLSLSHTTLTNKSHMKYRVQKIEQNYNQIWYGIKANKTHSCKLQLYKFNLVYLWLKSGKKKLVFKKPNRNQSKSWFETWTI